MRINKDKHIGRVLFIVEGSKYEFSLLQKIFTRVFSFNYVEKRRNRPDRFISGSDPDSIIAVINTRESNIRDITDHSEYLDGIFQFLQEKYDYPVDHFNETYLKPLVSSGKLLLTVPDKPHSPNQKYIRAKGI